MPRKSTSPKPVRPWISLSEGKKITSASRDALLRLANEGVVGTRQLPGCRALYSRADLLAMAASHTKPATVG